MNEDFQQDQGLQEQAVKDEMRAASAAATDLSQGTDLGNPALTAPTVAPAALPDATTPVPSDDELTNLAVQHIKSLGGEVSMPAQSPSPSPVVPSPSKDDPTVASPTNAQVAAQQFDQLARSISVSVSQEAGADGAAQEVYNFITQLGPNSVAAYQTNPLFRDMVDVKIDSIVNGHTKGLEECDKLPMPASEEVGGSTEKELRAGLNGHRQAFEKAGLGEHMSFDDFIRDLEL